MIFFIPLEEGEAEKEIRRGGKKKERERKKKSKEKKKKKKKKELREEEEEKVKKEKPANLLFLPSIPPLASSSHSSAPTITKRSFSTASPPVMSTLPTPACVPSGSAGTTFPSTPYGGATRPTPPTCWLSCMPGRESVTLGYGRSVP